MDKPELPLQAVKPLSRSQRNDGVDHAERHQPAKMVVVETPSEGKPSMGKSIGNLTSVTRVGLDLAKRVFQVHAVDANGDVVVRASSRAAISSRFSLRCRRAWWGWRRALRRTIGAGL